MDEPPETPPFAPNALDIVLVVGLAMAGMAHPVLFVLAFTLWSVYTFNRVLPGSLHRRLGGRAWPRLPRPAGPVSARAAPDRPASDQGVLAALLTQEPVPSRRRAGAEPGPRAPLPWRTWLQLVLEAPNVVVVGEPRAGKSTLVRALLPILAQQGQVVLLDPHSYKADWPWLAIGAGREYPRIVGALRALVAEMTRRYRHKGRDPRLTVVLDEVPSIVLYAGKDWNVLYPQLVCEGRKANIHTVILAQSGQVKPLGLEGKGDLRDALLWIYLGEYAIAEAPSTATMPKPAAIRWRDTVYPIDLSAVPVYARLPVDESAQWEPPPPVVPGPSPGASPTPDASPGLDAADAPVEPAMPEVTATELEYIATLHTCGYPPSSIAQMLPGYTSKQYRAYKDKVDYALRLLREKGPTTTSE